MRGAQLEDGIVESIVGAPVEFGFGGIEASVRYELARVRREGIAEAADGKASVFATEGSDDEAGLLTEGVDQIVPAVILPPAPAEKPADKEKERTGRGPDVAVTLAVRALFVLVFEAAREFLVDRRQGSGVSSEAIKLRGILAMNIFEDFGHGIAKCARRNATNHAGQNGVRAGFNPDIEIANV